MESFQDERKLLGLIILLTTEECRVCKAIFGNNEINKMPFYHPNNLRKILLYDDLKKDNLHNEYKVMIININFKQMNVNVGDHMYNQIISISNFQVDKEGNPYQLKFSPYEYDKAIEEKRIVGTPASILPISELEKSSIKRVLYDGSGKIISSIDKYIKKVTIKGTKETKDIEFMWYKHIRGGIPVNLLKQVTSWPSMLFALPQEWLHSCATQTFFYFNLLEQNMSRSDNGSIKFMDSKLFKTDNKMSVYLDVVYRRSMLEFYQYFKNRELYEKTIKEDGGITRENFRNPPKKEEKKKEEKSTFFMSSRIDKSLGLFSCK